MFIRVSYYILSSLFVVGISWTDRNYPCKFESNESNALFVCGCSFNFKACLVELFKLTGVFVSFKPLFVSLCLDVRRPDRNFKILRVWQSDNFSISGLSICMSRIEIVD